MLALNYDTLLSALEVQISTILLILNNIYRTNNNLYLKPFLVNWL